LTSFRGKADAKERAYREGGGLRERLRSTLSSAVLASLLFTEVASSIAGAEAVFFAALVIAWLILLTVVGLRNVLDAGCLFMLVSLGIVVVVDVANHGPGGLLT
jgi:4-amino-4-deoxy-L-arabinose transferase-like glycosyltransferase